MITMRMTSALTSTSYLSWCVWIRPWILGGQFILLCTGLRYDVDSFISDRLLMSAWQEFVYHDLAEATTGPLLVGLLPTDMASRHFPQANLCIGVYDRYLRTRRGRHAG